MMSDFLYKKVTILFFIVIFTPLNYALWIRIMENVVFGIMKSLKA